MQVLWKDVNFTEAPGEFPFEDGVVIIGLPTVTAWAAYPEAIFNVTPITGGGRGTGYVVGSRAD